jgi:hypothetical protein
MKAASAALPVLLVLAGCLQSEPLAHKGVELVDFQVQPEAFVEIGQALEASARVMNFGSDVATLRAVFSSNGAPVDPGRELQVWPGKDETARWFLRPQREGPLELALALSTGAERTASLRVGQPRIHIAGLEVRPDPVSLDRPVSVFADLRNAGSVPGTVDVLLSGNGGTLDELRGVTLQPGEASLRSLTTVAREKGEVRFAVLLSNGASATVAATVVAPALSVRAWHRDATACEVRAWATVANAGDGAAEGASAAILLRDEAGRDGVPQVRDLGRLEAGATRDAYASMTRSAPCDDTNPYRIVFRVTAGNAPAFELETPLQYA